MKPPSPWIGSDDDRGDVIGADLGLDRVDQRSQRLLGAVLRPSRPSERVGRWHPVDLWREGSEALLVRHVLGGHGHRQQAAAVVGVSDDDDGLPTGGGARDLDRVLHSLGAGGEQGGLLGVGAGCQAVERRGDLDEPLVLGDQEAGVRKASYLLGHALGHRRVRGADARHGNAGGEVDDVVAVDVDEDAATCVVDEDRQGRPQPDGELSGPLLVELDGARAGDAGLQDAALVRLRHVVLRWPV